MLSNSLSQLQGIHLPKAISWWPLAPGWYVVISLALIVIGLLIYCIFKRVFFIRRRQQVLNQIVVLEKYDNGAQVLAELSVLMKRIAVSFDAKSSPGSLYGDAWLKYLDETSCTNKFTQGVGRCLLNGPYQANIRIDTQLFDLVQLWARRMIC